MTEQKLNTRLSKLCKVLGWQGGTIYQANDEVSAYIERKVDCLSMDGNDFAYLFCYLYRNYQINWRTNIYD